MTQHISIKKILEENQEMEKQNKCSPRVTSCLQVMKVHMFRVFWAAC
jgi:hypothetical protein